MNTDEIISMISIEELDETLDREEIYKVILNSTDYLDISLELYFYVIIRHAFLRIDIYDRDVADYIATMLVRFSRTKSTKLQTIRKSPFVYISEVLLEIQKIDAKEQYYWKVFLAEQSLLMVCLFREFIERQVQRSAAPGIVFYENTARSTYINIAQHQISREKQRSDLYYQISEMISEIEAALIDTKEVIFHFDATPNFEF
jgi:hypothetical protein